MILKLVPLFAHNTTSQAQLAHQAQCCCNINSLVCARMNKSQWSVWNLGTQYVVCLSLKRALQICVTKQMLATLAQTRKRTYT